MEMLIAHASDAVSPPSKMRPDIPADLEAVVLRCLQKEPSNRLPMQRAWNARWRPAPARATGQKRWQRNGAHSRRDGERASSPDTDGVPTRQLTPLSV